MQLLEFAPTPDFYFFALLKLGLLGVLLAHSSLWRQPLLRSCLWLGSLLIGLGLVAILMHYLGAAACVLLGTGVAGFAYGRWFGMKPLPLLLDYLKLAWVSTVLLVFVCLVIYRPAIPFLAAIAEGLFWAMVLLFGQQRWLRR